MLMAIIFVLVGGLLALIAAFLFVRTRNFLGISASNKSHGDPNGVCERFGRLRGICACIPIPRHWKGKAL